MLIAEQKTTEFVRGTINSEVKSIENMTFDDMVDISIDNNGNVSVLGWNMASVNEALRMATDRAEYFLYGMNKGQTLDVDDPNMTPVEFGDSVGELEAKDLNVVEIAS